jgi:hypothetical protein
MKKKKGFRPFFKLGTVRYGTVAAVFRIRIRIGSGLNQVIGPVSGFVRAAYVTLKNKSKKTLDPSFN